MARQRRTSAVLETARQRLAGFKEIDPAPDFGGNLNAANLTPDAAVRPTRNLTTRSQSNFSTVGQRMKVRCSESMFLPIRYLWELR